MVAKPARRAARPIDSLRVPRVHAWLLALALTAACAPKPAPAMAPSAPLAPPDAGPAQPEGEPEPDDASAHKPDLDAELPPADSPEEVAQRWLEALRRPSVKLLGAWSRYPFFLHDTGTEGTCGHGAAADAAQLGQLLSCMLGNRALLEELRQTSDAAPTELKLKDLPAWARRWRNEVPADASLVLFEMLGHGNASHFLFVVKDGGVLALWKETVFDTQ